MDIFICSHSFHFAGIVSTSTRLSNIAHITSACVSSRWRHCVSSIRGLWIQNAPSHRLCASDQTCLFIFSFPLAFPSPTPSPATSCCVVTRDDFVESFLGLETYHRNAWKMTKLSAMKWSHCQLVFKFRFWTDPFFSNKVKPIFLPPFPWHEVSILPKPSPQLTHY